MSRRRLSFTERRRRALALKSAHLDKLETRNTITEPISVAGLSVTAFRGLAQMGIMTADGDNGEALRLALAAHRAKEAESHGGHPAAVSRPGAPPDPALPVEHKPAAGGGGGGQAPLAASLATATANNPTERFTPLAPSTGDSAQAHGISTPWRPAKGPGGGAALPPRGGSGAANPTRVASRASAPAARLPQSTPGAANSAALLAAVASASAGASAERRRGWRRFGRRQHRRAAYPGPRDRRRQRQIEQLRRQLFCFRWSCRRHRRHFASGRRFFRRHGQRGFDTRVDGKQRLGAKRGVVPVLPALRARRQSRRGPFPGRRPGRRCG